MKHIVKINELNSLELKREVRKFCEDHLVEILEDGGYKLYIDYYRPTPKTLLGEFRASFRGQNYSDLLKVDIYHNDHRKFSWEEICDVYIPVFEILYRRYSILGVEISDNNGKKTFKRDLLNVVKSDLGTIWYITLYLKDNKKTNEDIGDMWTSTSTDNKEYELDYTSRNSIYHGVRPINVSRNGVRAQVKAKFDSGAKSSSIDFKVAKKLGLSDHFISTCKKLDSVDLSKYTKDARNIPLLEQRRIEDLFFKELKKSFPEIVAVKLVKSSSGFSMRMTIALNIEYNGKVMQTDANVRDRTGLSCEMLVGLKDM